MQRFRHFDPYKEENDRRAVERAKMMADMRSTRLDRSKAGHLFAGLRGRKKRPVTLAPIKGGWT
jgi:hypothetical protein